MIWGSLESLILLYSKPHPLSLAAFLGLLLSTLLLYGACGIVLGGAVGGVHALLSPFDRWPFPRKTPSRFALASSIFSIAVISVLTPLYVLFRYSDIFDIEWIGSKTARVVFSLGISGAASLAAGGAITFLLWRLTDCLKKRIRGRHWKSLLAGLHLLVMIFGTWFGTSALEERGSADSGGADSRKRGPGVVLITVDTLRADHLGCYGNPIVKTPWMDLAAKEGVRFAQASCPVPITGPSHISLMTSLAPRTHGSRVNGAPYTGKDLTLAERLKRHGYRTAAFVAGYPLKAYNCGLNRGFDVYGDSFGFPDLHAGLRVVRLLNRLGLIQGAVERNAEEVNKEALRWLAENYEEPFFLWIHYFDPHFGYNPPPPYDTLYKGKMGPGETGRHRALYAGEVTWTDARIGEVMGLLQRLNIHDETLLIVTADHGESLGEHDYYYDHTEYLYEPIVRVPLIMRHPPTISKGRVVGERARIVDILPTILSIAGAPAGGRPLGQNLLHPMDGKTTGPDARSHALIETFTPESSVDRTAIRTPKWKWIVSSDRGEELYNLVDDPGERINLAGREEAIKRRFEEKLQTLLDSIPHSAEEAGELSIDSERLEKLRSLGYLK